MRWAWLPEMFGSGDGPGSASGWITLWRHGWEMDQDLLTILVEQNTLIIQELWALQNRINELSSALYNLHPKETWTAHLEQAGQHWCNSGSWPLERESEERDG